MFLTPCYSGDYEDIPPKDHNSIYSKLETLFTQLQAIEDPNGQAVEWLSLFKDIIDFHPNYKDSFLEKGRKLWTDAYPNKTAIELIINAELDMQKGHYQLAKQRAFQAIDIITKNDDQSINSQRLLCLSNSLIARFSKYTQEEQNGLRYCYKALELAEKADFIYGKVLVYNQLGLLLYYGRSEVQLALDNFNKAKPLLPLLEKPYHKSMSVFVLMNIARMKSELGDTYSSIKDMKAILNDNEDLKENPNLRIFIFSFLGKNYALLEDFERAESYLNQALEEFRLHAISFDKGITLFWMAFIQVKKGNLNAATNYITQIDSWLVNYSFKGDLNAQFYQLKSEIAKQKGQLKEAIAWMELATIERDSFNRKVNMHKLINLENQYQFKQIDQEKKYLQEEKKLNEKMITFQRFSIIALTLLGVSFLLATFLFYQQKKDIKEAYDFIIQNDKILRPESEKKEDALDSSFPDTLITTPLKNDILHALEKEKIFLSNDLTLKKFADHLNSNTSYVSKSINEDFGKNFSSLINEYRIKEIIQYFKEGQHLTYTIETLSQKAGFKSKSSFQKAFKKFTGVTASYYVEQLS